MFMQTTFETDLLAPALDWFGRRGWQPFAFQREGNRSWTR